MSGAGGREEVGGDQPRGLRGRIAKCERLVLLFELAEGHCRHDRQRECDHAEPREPLPQSGSAGSLGGRPQPIDGTGQQRGESRDGSRKNAHIAETGAYHQPARQSECREGNDQRVAAARRRRPTAKLDRPGGDRRDWQGATQ